jgi:hypothetical protein
MDTQKIVKLQTRQITDSLSNFQTTNAILMDGQISIARDSNNTYMKIGNGISRYNDLPFFNSGDEVNNGKSINISIESGKRYETLDKALEDIEDNRKELGQTVIYLDIFDIWNSFQFTDINIDNYNNIEYWNQVDVYCLNYIDCNYDNAGPDDFIEILDLNKKQNTIKGYINTSGYY